MPTYATTINFKGRTTIVLCAANHGAALDEIIADLSPDELIADGCLKRIEYTSIDVNPLLAADGYANYHLAGDLPFSPWPNDFPRTVAGYFRILDDEQLEVGSLLYQQRAEELGQQLLFLPVQSQAN